MTANKKIILVLGGTGDIGAAVADAFEKKRAVVCRHGTSSGDYKADFSKNGVAKQLIQTVLKDHGRIDVLVNAVSAPASVLPFEKKTWEDFARHLNIQLKASVETTHALISAMKEQGGGKIITIGTVYVGTETPSGLSDYLTAKYALWGLTQSLAKELGKYNIMVNMVSPSFIRNRFNTASPKKLDDIIVHQTPLGRLATEDDIAGTVLFLASPAADFITGQNIIVSGGSDL